MIPEDTEQALGMFKLIAQIEAELPVTLVPWLERVPEHRWLGGCTWRAEIPGFVVMVHAPSFRALYLEYVRPMTRPCAYAVWRSSDGWSEGGLALAIANMRIAWSGATGDFSGRSRGGLLGG